MPIPNATLTGLAEFAEDLEEYQYHCPICGTSYGVSDDWDECGCHEDILYGRD